MQTCKIFHRKSGFVQNKSTAFIIILHSGFLMVKQFFRETGKYLRLPTFGKAYYFKNRLKPWMNNCFNLKISSMGSVHNGWDYGIDKVSICLEDFLWRFYARKCCIKILHQQMEFQNSKLALWNPWKIHSSSLSISPNKKLVLWPLENCIVLYRKNNRLQIEGLIRVCSGLSGCRGDLDAQTMSVNRLVW